MDKERDSGMQVTVCLNIRGIRYEISRSLLDRVATTHPASVLASLNDKRANYDRERREFYFYRNPWLFSSIWDFFTSGQAHVPPTVCLGAVRQELDFWGLPDDILAPCCWDKLQAQEEAASRIRRFRAQWDSPKHGPTADTCRERVRLFLESPHYSYLSKVWSLFITGLIAVSIILVMISTLKHFREINQESRDTYHNLTGGRLQYYLRHSRPVDVFIALEAVTTSVLSAEFLLRWSLAAQRCRFLVQPLNLIDMLGIFLTWIMFALHFIRDEETSLFGTIRYVVTVMRVFRVFRVLRMAQAYPAMRILYLAIRASYKEVLLLMTLVSIGALIFGHFIFLLEVGEDNITSIPHGMWWAVVTMTTVGYGDVYPVTVSGRVLGAVCAMAGILVIGLPVPIIVNNFGAFYDTMRVCNRARTNRCKPGHVCASDVTADITADVKGNEQIDVPNETAGTVNQL